MDIWAEFRETISTVTIKGELIRIVESQEQIATNSLVDNLAEQALLEQILERSKPPLPAGTQQLHYLLATPFRYPPLPYGSRFGARHEPGIFYGSKQLQSALAEAAYYRFVFWSGMRTPPPSSRFVTQHTVFAASYATVTGLQLQHAPFAAYETQLTARDNYADTQQLGSAMREYGVQAFEYISARDTGRGINVALFSAAALSGKNPLYQQSWLCETNAHAVSFSQANDKQVYQFNLEVFLVNGKLPLPAV